MHKRTKQHPFPPRRDPFPPDAPGITGLAQVEGWRGETAELSAMARRVEADLRYRRDWSLGINLRNLLRILFHLRSGKAY